jgi:tRNA (guanine26-N2/guanine27-N2)-dimethyltransferase
VSNQHKDPTAIKTDAPPDAVWDVMRCWVQKHPVGERARKENSPAAKILAKAPALKANFSLPPQLLGPKKKVKRFPPNPEAFWGPKARAHGGKKRARGEGEGEVAVAGGDGEKGVEMMKDG